VAVVGVSIFQNSASFYAPLREGTVRSTANRGGVQKVVSLRSLARFAPLFPAIHCSAGAGSAGAPFWNMLTRVAEAFSKRLKEKR